MTHELARVVVQRARHGPGPDAAGHAAWSDCGALDRRLVTAAELPPPAPRRTVASTDPRARAVHLAAGLGGTVEEGAGGPVVVVERATPLPMTLDGLARLPYPVDMERPLVYLDTETTGLGTAAGTLAFLVGIGRWDGVTSTSVSSCCPITRTNPPASPRSRPRSPPTPASSRTTAVPSTGRCSSRATGSTGDRLRSPPGISTCCPSPVSCGDTGCPMPAWPAWRPAWPGCGVTATCPAPSSRSVTSPGCARGVPPCWRTSSTHNREDVVSLGRLLGEMSERLADPERRRSAHPGDVASLARVFRRDGRQDEALACYAEALAAWDEREPAPTRLDRDTLAAEAAGLLSRTGRHAEAEAAWRALADRGGSTAVWAWIALAKHREHRARDPAGAMEAALRALRIVERRRAVGIPLRAAERDLARRLARLHRRARSDGGRARRLT